MAVWAASAGSDWWMARTNAQQSISASTTTTITTWDEFDSGGAGGSWAYSSGTLTVPAGTYQFAGGGLWSSGDADVLYQCEVRSSPLTGIFIGNGAWPSTAVGPLQSFAGVDFFTTSTDLTFKVLQQSSSARNFDRMHWLVVKLG